MGKLIVFNWKMNPASLKEAKSLFSAVSKKIKKTSSEIVFCPPSAYLFLFQKKQGFKLGAQNCHWEERGAFTGEVSALQLSSLGCSYIILGHSERRKQGETSETVKNKVNSVLESGLMPVLCIGESREQRDRGEEQKVLEQQILESLEGISQNKLKTKGLCIAYEPVWAIGTGMPCDPEEAQKMMLFIKKVVSGIYPLDKIKILYGGSVNSKNAEEYIKESGYDGLLVGGSSLDPEEFSKISKLF